MPKKRYGSVLVALAAISTFLAACGQRSFDREAWVSANVDTGNARKQMVKDLLHDHPLKGKTRAEVLALLGPAERTDKWANYDLVYVLGPQGVDYDWLAIKLGPDGKVSEFVVAPD